MTNRLYNDNTYLTDFDAVVLECTPKADKYVIKLNQSAFYPTSGGQPYDTGHISDADVTDVYVDSDGEVWHEVSAPFDIGCAVHGIIDWERRFDHMQQHAGEHLLANAAYRLLHGETIGLHLGNEVSSIDMTLPEGRTHITAEEIASLEDDVNSRIQQDVPIRQWFPDKVELSQLPLRKPPTVDEHIRIVQIGELEFCACGGTHPSTAGQIGLVKIVDARPARGKLRLTFVCGKRAFELLRKNYDLLHQTSDAISASYENVPALVKTMDGEVRRLTRELYEAKKTILISNASVMLDRAAINENGIRIVSEFVEADTTAARELATHLINTPRTIAVIGAKIAVNYSYIVCRSNDVDCNCGAYLSSAAKRSGGKGGGRPDFAQGGGPAEMLDFICAECSSAAK